MNAADELLELPPTVEAVPIARHHARRVLEGAAVALVADVELVVSELVGNAALHGAPPVRLRLRRPGPDLVRVEVHDAGRAVPVRVRPDEAAMTGRGLGMVATLAAGWGVDAAASGGKLVWAELHGSKGAASSASTGQVDVEALLAAWDDGDEELHTVTLGAVSTELLLGAKAHIDNVVRELTLLGEAGGAPVPGVAALVRAATVDFADARAEIKRQAAAAASRGEALTDLVLHLPASAADAAERYLAALDEADRWARAARLLTLAPPRVHRVFRRWYVGAIVASLRALAAGATLPPPEPLQVVLAREVTALDELLAARDRGGRG